MTLVALLVTLTVVAKAYSWECILVASMVYGVVVQMEKKMIEVLDD